jgi:hypothetical protein
MNPQLIRIATSYPNSLSNPEVREIFLPCVPRVGEIVQDCGCHFYEVTEVRYQPFPRQLDNPPMIELVLKELR